MRVEHEKEGTFDLPLEQQQQQRQQQLENKKKGGKRGDGKRKRRIEVLKMVDVVIYERPIKEDNKSSEKDMSKRDSGTASRPIIHWLKPDSRRLMRSAYRRVRGDHSRWTGIIIRQRLAIVGRRGTVAADGAWIWSSSACRDRGKKPFLEAVNYVVASSRDSCVPIRLRPRFSSIHHPPFLLLLNVLKSRTRIKSLRSRIMTEYL